MASGIQRSYVIAMVDGRKYDWLENNLIGFDMGVMSESDASATMAFLWNKWRLMIWQFC